MKTLLVEIRTEELPPKVLWDLADSFPDMLLDALKKAGFADDNSQRAKNKENQNKKLATPRRLVALLQEIKAESAAEIYRRGPQLVACRDSENNPTKALIGFMQSVGATCEKDLIQIEEKCKTYIAWKGMQAGKKLSTELAAIVERVLLNLPAPRLMRWGDNDFKFVRPVRGVLMLHGDKFINGKIMNIDAENKTVGHPFLSTGEVAIKNADEYEKIMKEKGRVIVDMGKRLDYIADKMRDEDFGDSLFLIDDELDESESMRSFTVGKNHILTGTPLLNEVAAMCEFPTVYWRIIDNAFMSFPLFCISECMKNHQRFFSFTQNNKLSHHYCLVTDNAPDNLGEMLRDYDEVLRARLNDVKFYLEEDKKIPKADYVEKLKSITFHKKLGSQHARIERICQIAESIAPMIDRNYATIEIRQAAESLLAPLPTLMCREYPVLQMDLSKIYFRNDNLQRGVTGFVGLCHDLEKLVGIFGVGEKSTGSKDPHGLRRIASDIAMAFVGVGHLFTTAPSMNKIIAVAIKSFNGKISDVHDEVYNFIIDRIRFAFLGRRSIIVFPFPSPKILNSLLLQKPDDFRNFATKVEAIHDFCKTPESQTLAAADKRIKNILRKSNMDAQTFAAPDESLFTHDEERDLWNCIKELQNESDSQIAKEDFKSALQTLAKSATPINNFFDKVLVNAEDKKIRDNRFALLAQTQKLLNQVCDISKLESPS